MTEEQIKQWVEHYRSGLLGNLYDNYNGKTYIVDDVFIERNEGDELMICITLAMYPRDRNLSPLKVPVEYFICHHRPSLKMRKP